VTLHRFFLPARCFAADRVEFPAEAAHQIRRVLRLGAGDRIIALDGSGDEYVVRLDGDAPLTGTVESRRHNESEPALQLTLYVGLLKAAKLELVLQKGTEVGVARFVPVETARSVAREPGAARHARREAIIREAAEQSGRGRVPKLAATMALADAIDEAVAGGRAILLWERENAAQLGEMAPPVNEPFSLFVGPEGGFADDEVALARGSGVVTASLGRRILRAETAAIVAPALVLLRRADYMPVSH